MLVLHEGGGNNSTLHGLIKLIWTFYTQSWWDTKGKLYRLPLHFTLHNTKGVKAGRTGLVQRLDTKAGCKGANIGCDGWAQRQGAKAGCKVQTQGVKARLKGRCKECKGRAQRLLYPLCLCTLCTSHALCAKWVTWWNLHHLIFLLCETIIDWEQTLSSPVTRCLDWTLQLSRLWIN